MRPAILPVAKELDPGFRLDEREEAQWSRMNPATSSTTPGASGRSGVM